MTKTIHKYPLELKARQPVNLPIGAEVRCVHEQNGKVVVWAEIDLDETRLETRQFWIRGTGDLISDEPRKYLGTAFVGIYAWHVFEATT